MQLTRLTIKIFWKAFQEYSMNYNLKSKFKAVNTSDSKSFEYLF